MTSRSYFKAHLSENFYEYRNFMELMLFGKQKTLCYTLSVAHFRQIAQVSVTPECAPEATLL